MKILKMLKLGHKNFTLHKKTSAVFTIILAAVLSVFVFSVYSSFDLKNENAEKLQSETNGKVFLALSICENSYIENSLEKLCLEPEKYDKIAENEIAKYHGELIGAVITYQSENSDDKVYVIPDKAANILNVEPAYFAPDDKVPVVKNKNASAKTNDINHYILGEFSGNEKDAETYLVLDKTLKADYFVFVNGFRFLYYAPLVVFDDMNDAYEFYKNTDIKVSEKFSSATLRHENYLENICALQKFLIAIILIFVLSCAALIFILYRFDTKLVSLYRSQGATKRNVVSIYVIYMLEIFVFAAILSAAFGSLAKIISH